MIKAPLYNAQNETVGEIELPVKLFGAPWRPALIKQILIALQANRRRPWAHAKDRSEVRGGGRKPWRQKGTGRSRHGSSRSPIWRHGGKAHGPNKERDYTQKINKKMRQAALASVLSKKLKDGEIKFLDTLSVAEPKTRLGFQMAQKILGMAPRAKRVDALFIPSREDKNTFRATRNLLKAKAVRAEDVNVEDILNFKYLIADQSAVGAMEKHYRNLKISK